MMQNKRFKGHCKQCGKEVGAYYKSQVPTFCSYECSNQWKWDNVRQKQEKVPVVCTMCGKSFEIAKSDWRLKEGRKHFFCSHDCCGKYYHELKKKEKVCPICGQLHHKSNAITCSIKCGYELKRYNSYKKKHNLLEISYIEYLNRLKIEEEEKNKQKESFTKVLYADGRIRYYEQEHFVYSGREKDYMKEYHAKNKAKRREKHKKKMQDDEVYKFKVKVRKFISQSFKRRKESKMMHTEEVLGCSFEEFMKHLCSLFREGMTIDNYGEWQIDHIIPLSTAKTKEDVIRLCHYTNLQPLWAKENNEKRDKLNYIIQDPI